MSNESPEVCAENYFHPIEHLTVSKYLDVEPPKCADSDDVRRMLTHKQSEEYFIAPYGCMSEDFANAVARLLRDNRSSVNRPISFPSFVCTLEWPTALASDETTSYVETYNVSFLPFYNKYVVTADVQRDLLTSTWYIHPTFAIGHFSSDTPISEGVQKVLAENWTKRLKDRGERWHKFVDEGLVTKEVGEQWAADLYNRESENTLELPVGFPEEWRNWECELDVSFWLTAYTCVHSRLYDEYERDNIEAAAATVFDYKNYEIFVGYRLHPKEVIPAFEWYVSWPVQRRGSDDAIVRRRPRQGDAPWELENENTLCTLWNDPRGMYGWELAGTSQVYMLRAGGRTKDEAIENWYKCAKVFRRILKEVFLANHDRALLRDKHEPNSDKDRGNRPCG